MGDAPVTQPESRGFMRRLPGLLKLMSILGILAVIVVMGGHQLAEKYAIIKPIQFIGHSDSAAYATAGKSLSEGLGLQVRYISEFFIPYSPGITRQEDHWPPFMGLCIAPCYYLLGFHVWVAKLPAIFFGSIGLPLTTALLAYALSRRGYVAIVAGLLMMIHPELYEASLTTLCDLSVGMLLAGFCGSVILAQRRPRMHLAAGVFLALAYFSKGSQLILFGMYPLMAVLCAGPRVLLRKYFWAGIAVALLLIAPYWYANWRAYGNPLHSVQNYISGFYGLEDWDQTAYFPFWGNDLPKTSDRWNKYGKRFWQHAADNREELARDAITGREVSSTLWLDFGKYGIWFRDLLLPAPKPTFLGQFLGGSRTPQPSTLAPKPIARWEYPATELPAAGSVLLLVVLMAASPAMLGMALWKWFLRRKSPPPAEAPGDADSHEARKPAEPIRPPWMLGPVLALAILVVVEASFLAYLWDIQPRFCYMFLPFFAAVGCAAASRFIEWPLHGLLIACKNLVRWLARNSAQGTLRVNEFFATLDHLRHWHLAVTILLAAIVLLRYQNVNAWVDASVAREFNGRVYDEPETPRMGDWIAQHIPNAVIMCRNPWELLYYCSPTNKAIGSPNPKSGGPVGADQILAIAHYYGVTHLYADSVRAPLVAYLVGRNGAFKRVAGAPGPLYEIDWSKIPVKSPEEALAEK